MYCGWLYMLYFYTTDSAVDLFTPCKCHVWKKQKQNNDKYTQGLLTLLLINQKHNKMYYTVKV